MMEKASAPDSPKRVNIVYLNEYITNSAQASDGVLVVKTKIGHQ